MSHPAQPPARPPLLVTLGLEPAAFAQLDSLRRRYFPPGRNFIPAHLSLFHHLPGAEQPAVERALAQAAERHGPVALHFTRLVPLGRGMAARAEEAPALRALHAELARAFAPWLTPQDRQPLTPHVTLMNKATPEEARAALAELGRSWAPLATRGEALLLWRYLGGPWEPLGRFPLRAG
ncbi:2'-5' RNA ligase family protein [Aggregicoccus sp. 17bor-14]|uniref:2'-5' RNA ligase family protein n=1 Tax=Myxococcaceae TaxID=31 RepID=UPI00129C8331|nr:MULTISPECIES: 2'-5' RNA ligase family protein [Myxococcaceae]MBF5043788.1 2'-5' RNA ligase family protein [Simulacricoccus sp. 17bor-14]MRI89541.1 2'-5' RNA ligase family protein [Aggregicoccus sp. 17bor-14]